VTAVADTAAVAPAATDARRAGQRVVWAAAIVLCLWVLGPI
jgi:hypothetical protein